MMTLKHIVAAVTVLAIAGSVDGAVLCRKKSGAVLYRDAACKKKETALDLAALGATGPKGTDGAQGAQGPAGTSVVTKSGAVNANGTLQYGSSGVTTSKTGSAQYRIAFAPGTWSPAGFTAVFSPVDSATVISTFSLINTDGSGTLDVTLTSEVVFLFIAVAL